MIDHQQSRIVILRRMRLDMEPCQPNKYAESVVGESLCRSKSTIVGIRGVVCGIREGICWLGNS